MALPTPVNGQITDAVTQTNLLNLGSAPSAASANLAHAASQAFALMMQNATSRQPHEQALADAASARAIALIAR